MICTASKFVHYRLTERSLRSLSCRDKEWRKPGCWVSCAPVNESVLEFILGRDYVLKRNPGDANGFFSRKRSKSINMDVWNQDEIHSWSYHSEFGYELEKKFRRIKSNISVSLHRPKNLPCLNFKWKWIPKIAFIKLPVLNHLKSDCSTSIIH